MVYIYEHIRTRGFSPLHFEEHLLHLDTLSRKIFGTPLSVGAEVLREAVAEEVQRSGLSSLMENAVEVRISEEGELEVEAIELIYNNFSLRALHPEGAIHNLSGELITENTSAKKAIVELLDSTARHSNKKSSIWVNDNEEVIAIDGAPAVVVFDDEIRFSRIGEGVEFELAKRVTSLHNRKITTAEIRLDDIYRAKELFSIDYRGILALEKVGNHLYMDIVAEKIAGQVARSER